MIANRFWKVTWMQKPRRARILFFERSDNVTARRKRCLSYMSPGVFITLYLTLQNRVFMWHIFDGRHAWDRVRGCVFEQICTFPSIQRNSFFDLKNYIKSFALRDIPFNTHSPIHKRIVCVSVSVQKRDTKRETEEKRVRTRESEPLNVLALWKGSRRQYWQIDL